MDIISNLVYNHCKILIVNTSDVFIEDFFIHIVLWQNLTYQLSIHFYNGIIYKSFISNTFTYAYKRFRQDMKLCNY